jgi:hypothetical protein
MQMVDVMDVHDADVHIIVSALPWGPMNTEGVGSAVPRLSPRMVILAEPVVGPLRTEKNVTLGPEYVKKFAREPMTLPSTTFIASFTPKPAGPPQIIEVAETHWDVVQTVDPSFVDVDRSVEPKFEPRIVTLNPPACEPPPLATATCERVGAS